MSALRAVTLDAVGTLFAPAEPVGATYGRVAARHGIALPAADLDTRFRAAFASAPPLAFGNIEPAERVRRERAWWRALVCETFGPAGDHPGFDACFGALFAHYGHADAWRVFPEVAGTLTRLRARGLWLGVVSNFDGRLPGVLAGLGLAPLLDAILLSTVVGVAKPAGGIFRAAAAALAAPPDDMLHAGDDVQADVAGALAAGLRAVLVDRAGWRPVLPRGACAITTLAEIEAFLG